MRYAFATVLLVSLCATRAWAWSDHASLLWPVISSLPKMSDATVAAESLETFLVAQAPAIERALEDHERWTAEQGLSHALTPKALRFDPAASDLKAAFISSIRVNPTLSYRLYTQQVQGSTVADNDAEGDTEIDAESHAENTAESGIKSYAESYSASATQVGNKNLHWSDLSFLESGTSHERVIYSALEEGALLTPAAIMAAANDEPDLGMDVGLFSNNGTPYGAHYGFGEQPFGNPNLSYGSQAPFHMGFYHLDWLTRTAQPSLLKTYPIWRIALYDRLAVTAFQAGHSYWGWRFMGWAMHYLGDLTQPYHALPLPGVSTFDALWLVAMGETNAAIQKVSNRHGVLESYQYQRLLTSLQAAAPGEPFIPTLTAGSPTPSSDDVQHFVMRVTAMSVAAAADLDAVLATQAPRQFVDDSAFEWVGSGEEQRIVDAIIANGGETAVATLDQAVMVQLRRFSDVARSWVARALRHQSRNN